MERSDFSECSVFCKCHCPVHVIPMQAKRQDDDDDKHIINVGLEYP